MSKVSVVEVEANTDIITVPHPFPTGFSTRYLCERLVRVGVG